MVEEKDHVFINSVNQMDMIIGRLFIRTKFDDAINMMNEVRKYYDDNKKNHNYQVVAEALEVLIYHFGDFQSKNSKGDFGNTVTEHLHYFLNERKKINITPMGM